MALSFVPLPLFDQAYQIVISARPAGQAITNLIKYFERTWLGVFDKSVWNHAKTIGPRTNNHVEGFHSGLNKAIGNPHPKIVSIVEEFQKLANKADRDASRIDNGTKSNVYRRKCDKAKDEDISLTIQKLLDGVMDLSQFLNYSIKFIANDKK